MKLYIPFKPLEMTIHNIIGHPLYEVFNLLGLDEIANLIHDHTLPPSDEV